MEKSVNPKKVVYFGLFLVALAYASMKLSVPALPELQHLFCVSPLLMKSSAAIFLLAYALAQIVWGGLAKFHLRRRLIFIALGAALLGALCAMTATGITQFVIGRILEGIGISAASPLCRVLFADELSKQNIANISVMFGVIFCFMPFVAPTIGQYILLYTNWRWIFAFFCLLCVLYVILAYLYLPETAPSDLQAFSLRRLLVSYWVVLRTRAYWGYCLGMMAFSGGLVGYYMAVPYWYRVHFHVSDHYYTVLTLLTAVPNVVVYYVGRFVVKKYDTIITARMSHVGAVLAFLVSAILLCWHVVSIVTLVIPLVIFSSAAGLAMCSANVGLLTYFRHERGAIGSLLPLLPFLFAPLMFLIWTNITLKFYWPFVLVMLGLALICLLAFYLVGYEAS